MVPKLLVHLPRHLGQRKEGTRDLKKGKKRRTSRRPRSRQGPWPRRRPPARFESGSCTRAGRVPGPQGEEDGRMGGEGGLHPRTSVFRDLRLRPKHTTRLGRKRSLNTSRAVGGRASSGLTCPPGFTAAPPPPYDPSLSASLPPYLGTPCFLTHVQQGVAFLPGQTPPS
jgi:hypothetical protein